MDYEKKYKDAQKWIESIYTELSHEHQMEAESFFPELKESEDERIRKAMIKGLSSCASKYWGGFEIKAAIAWLEKQGEPTDNDMVEALRTEYEKGRADAIAEMQKEWSEEDENFMYDTLSNLTELKDRYGKDYGNVGKCMDWIKSLKQRIGG